MVYDKHFWRFCVRELQVNDNNLPPFLIFVALVVVLAVVPFVIELARLIWSFL